ncbi:hypothetical protein D3C76_1840120 [compost metagenome]
MKYHEVSPRNCTSTLSLRRDGRRSLLTYATCRSPERSDRLLSRSPRKSKSTASRYGRPGCQ